MTKHLTLNFGTSRPTKSIRTRMLVGNLALTGVRLIDAVVFGRCVPRIFRGTYRSIHREHEKVTQLARKSRMESNLSEEEDLPMTLHREGILGHDQDRAPRKTDRDEKRGLDVSREVGERARRTQVQPATVRDRRTDVRTDEGGIEL